VKRLISPRKISVQKTDSLHILPAVRNEEGYKATTSQTSSGTVHIALWIGSSKVSALPPDLHNKYDNAAF